MKLEEKNGLRILTPKEGCLLRRKGQDNNFSPIVYLGINDSEDNYEDITEEKVAMLMQEEDNIEEECEEQE